MAPPDAQVHSHIPSVNGHFVAHSQSMDTGREDARVAIDKAAGGRYKDGFTGYTQVSVLLMYWENDNLSCKKEIEELAEVFQGQFRFSTEIFKIPSRPNVREVVCKKLSDWSRNSGVENKLNILYYGGHGEKIEGVSDDLMLMGYDKDGPDGEPPTHFNVRDMYAESLSKTTDTLLIMDCCYSARAFPREAIDARKFELLSSVPPDQLAMGPRFAGSFTQSLCDALTSLLEESNYQGFSTSALYRYLYFSQPNRIKPFLFDISPKDYGRIWLRSLLCPGTSSSTTCQEEENVCIELKLRVSMIPGEGALADLTSYLQNLTYVRRIEFQGLQFPEGQRYLPYGKAWILIIAAMLIIVCRSGSI